MAPLVSVFGMQAASGQTANRHHIRMLGNRRGGGGSPEKGTVLSRVRLCNLGEAILPMY